MPGVKVGRPGAAAFTSSGPCLQWRKSNSHRYGWDPFPTLFSILLFVYASNGLCLPV